MKLVVKLKLKLLRKQNAVKQHGDRQHKKTLDEKLQESSGKKKDGAKRLSKKLRLQRLISAG